MDKLIVSEICEYINKNIYGGYVTLDDLSKRFHYSPNQIIRIFRGNLNTTPHDYILKLKIDISKKMLLCYECTINEIAERLNFYDSCHFSKTFKSLMGIPPSVYRSMYREKSN